jgi:hypothetical protein
LPLNEYGLRVFGYDEFLDENTTLGSFLFVGNSIAFGQDVRLEVARHVNNSNQTAIIFTRFIHFIKPALFILLVFRTEFPKSMLLNAQNFEGYVQTILGYINHLAKEQGL